MTKRETRFYNLNHRITNIIDKAKDMSIDEKVKFEKRMRLRELQVKRDKLVEE